MGQVLLKRLHLLMATRGMEHYPNPEDSTNTLIMTNVIPRDSTMDNARLRHQTFPCKAITGNILEPFGL